MKPRKPSQEARLHCHCRNCENEATKSNYKKNSDTIKKRARQSYEQNRHQKIELTKQWKENNKDKAESYRKKWYSQNKAYHYQKNKNATEHLESRYVREKLRRQGWPKSLLGEHELIETKKILLTLKRKSNGKTENSPGIKPTTTKV